MNAVAHLERSMHPTRLGVLGMVASSVLFSAMSCLVRLGDNLDPYVVSLARFGIGMVFIATMAMSGHLNLSFVNRRLLFIRGILGGIGVVIFYAAIIHLGLAKGTVISYAYPIFAAVGGALFMGERMDLRRWAVTFAAFFGLYLTVTNPGEFGSGFGAHEALALAGAVIAGAVVCIIKRLRATDTAASIFTAQCAAGFWIVILPANSHPADMGLQGSILLLAIGLLAAGGQLVMTYSYKHLPVSSGSLLALLSPVLNVLAGAVFFAEHLTARNAVGMALVLAACGVISRAPPPTPSGGAGTAPGRDPV